MKVVALGPVDVVSLQVRCFVRKSWHTKVEEQLDENVETELSMS